MLLAYDYNSYLLGLVKHVSWSPKPTSPPHFLIVGPSGTGKTIFSAELMGRAILHAGAKLWIASYKDDDFFQGIPQDGTTRYFCFEKSIAGIHQFYEVLQERLGGNANRSLCFLWVDELAAMVTGLPKKESDTVKSEIAVILQTGRSLNCQLLVSVQRADSTYFNNGARENFGNVVFLGSNITKEAAGMFGIDRSSLPKISGRAGYLIVNGDSDHLCPIKIPIIRSPTKLRQAILRGLS